MIAALTLAQRHWKLFAGLGAGLVAGALLGSWWAAGERARLASDLSACERADADAAKSALAAQSETVERNTARTSELLDQLSGAASRFDQVRSEPREIVYRVECLSGGDDRERLCRIAPDHPDCAD